MFSGYKFFQLNIKDFFSFKNISLAYRRGKKLFDPIPTAKCCEKGTLDGIQTIRITHLELQNINTILSIF